MRITGTRRSKPLARQLRRSLSFPEVLLWLQLRRRPAGLRFRRQHAAGAYVLDFFCAPANLAVEVDGEAHDRGDRPYRDEVRDLWLRSQGLEVMRIPAREVLADLEAVVLLIIARSMERMPPPPPVAVPLPR